MAGDAARGRVLGVDLGDKRIGLARSSSDRTVALPYEVIVRSGDVSADRARLAAVVDELAITHVVVGVPVGLDGRHGPAAKAVLGEIEALRATLAVPVDAVDERMTTAEVLHRRRETLQREGAQRRGGRGGRSRPPAGPSAARRPVVDDLAATVLLQHWLELRRLDEPAS